MTDFSDDVLIARSKADPACFEEVFSRWWPPISRYLAARLGIDDGAQAASEVFVRAFDRRTRYEPRDGSAGPWLYGIAANLVADHRRRERRHVKALARLRQDRPGHLLASESGIAMAELARMPLATRETVLLWVWADLPHEQIAQALDVSVGTVASRISRYRAALAAKRAVSAPSNLPIPEAHHV